MKRIVTLALLAIVVASTLSTSPCHAQAGDPRAQDAVAIFMSFCVATLGSRDKALERLGAGNQLAVRLSDEKVKALQSGRAGGVAWAVSSPKGAQLLLEYEARGICGVRVAEAEERSMQSGLDLALRKMAQQLGAKLVESSPGVRTQQGVRRTFAHFVIESGAGKGLIALTTSDRRVGEQQHFMTFSR